MKITPFILLVALLTGCKNVPNATQENSAAIVKLPEALQLFKDACLSTAPSFKKAQTAAESQGISNFKDIGWMVMALTEDKRLSVQIQKNKECAITTPSSSGKEISDAFFQMVSDYMGYKVSPYNPVTLGRDGRIFLVFHDRKGGEAFVIAELK